MASRGVVAIVGAGPGLGQLFGHIPLAVAKRFGRERFKVAFVSLAKDTLEQYTRELRAEGVETQSFGVDVFKLENQPQLYEDIRDRMGPVTVLVWNHFAHVLDPVLSQTPEQLTAQFSGLAAFVRSVQLVVPGMESQREGHPAVLVTGLGLGLSDEPAMLQQAAETGRNMLAAHAAAKHSLAGTLRHTLLPRGIRVAEVVLKTPVEGSVDDTRDGTVHTVDSVAERYWELYNRQTDNKQWLSIA